MDGESDKKAKDDNEEDIGKVLCFVYHKMSHNSHILALSCVVNNIY